jgi:hypothetical protein
MPIFPGGDSQSFGTRYETSDSRKLRLALDNVAFRIGSSAKSTAKGVWVVNI